MIISNRTATKSKITETHTRKYFRFLLIIEKKKKCHPIPSLRPGHETINTNSDLKTYFRYLWTITTVVWRGVFLLFAVWFRQVLFSKVMTAKTAQRNADYNKFILPFETKRKETQIPFHYYIIGTTYRWIVIKVYNLRV